LTATDAELPFQGPERVAFDEEMRRIHGPDGNFETSLPDRNHRERADPKMSADAKRGLGYREAPRKSGEFASAIWQLLSLIAGGV